MFQRDCFEESKSQVHQDLFVLGVTEKRHGFFIEIGGFHSEELSNTFLLEQKFGWRGVTVEILLRNASEIARNRRTTVICEDATRINWSEKLTQLGIPLAPDYLQVDCEPALSSLLALIRVMMAGVRPKVITFEHDIYSGARLLRLLDQGHFVRFSSRLLLSALGYNLVAPNIATQSGKPFEDWWVKRPFKRFPYRPHRAAVTSHEEFLTRNGIYAAYIRLGQAQSGNKQ